MSAICKTGARKTWTFPRPQDTEMDHQALLKANGFIVVPTALAADPALLKSTRESIFESISNSPEFLEPKPDTDDWKPQLGGFAAMANPSSFHELFIRKLRNMICAQMLTDDVLPLDGKKLEMVFDRLLYRIKGETPTAESLHRDEALTACDGDVLFGGWVNLDPKPQHFSCVPGTHMDVGGQNKGFAKIPKEDYPMYTPRLRLVEIPPGCALVFYERLVHEVLSTPAQHLMLRMYIGFRVTEEDEPLFGTAATQKWIRTQAVPKIKSGQDPPVYPSAYSNFPKNFPKLTYWSQRTFRGACIQVHTVGSGDYAGSEWPRVKARMGSLEYYSLPLHPQYDVADEKLLFPSREWRLYTFDSPHERVSFRAVSKREWQAFQVAQGIAGRNALRPKPERE